MEEVIIGDLMTHSYNDFSCHWQLILGASLLERRAATGDIHVFSSSTTRAPKVVFIIAPLKALADQHAASAKEYEWEPNKASIQIQVPSRSVRLRLKSL